MRTKLAIAALVAVLAFYCVMVGTYAVALVRDGGIVPVLLGFALFISAGLAIGLALREIQFGRRTAVLGAQLAAEGGLPADELPRRPSGRVDRAAADSIFEQRKAEAEADSENWRTWFRLALAYDAAGDRTRARSAARHAVALYR